MRSSFALRVLLALATMGAVTACDQEGPTATRPTPQPMPLLTALRCTASVAGKTVSCASAAPETGANKLLLGGQGVYVQLTSSNVQVVADSFTFDVTMQNLLPSPQIMATTDGVSGTAEGVQIFFSSLPTTTAGSGNVTVANPDGLGAFTGSNQPYFQYSGAQLGADNMLTSNETSASRTWKLQFDPLVESFGFVVYVATAVRYPNGWIDVAATPNMLAGGTQSLTGTVRAATGVVQGGAITWGTADAGVATVDGAGTVTAVSPGTVSITATAGVRTGQASISVCPNLAVGGVYTAVMPLASSLCFGGGAGAEEFTYMPVNLSSSSALSLTVTASGIQAVTGPPSPNRVPGASAFARIDPDLDARDAFHGRMMEQDRRLVHSLANNPDALIRRTSRARAPGGAQRLITVGVPSVGDLMNLNVAQGCSGALDTRVGQVRSIGQHVIVVSDTANPAGGFTTAQYDSIALEFDSLAYAVDTTNFGGPTDLDSNQRVVAFYTRAVNELSPPASSVVVLGYFTGRDLFSSAPASCPRSNEGEMFYMLVPDPTGAVNSNVRTVSFVRGSTVGTMAHELQHLINGSRRVYENGTWNGLFEEVWLNEGLSHIAEELVFYRASVGLTPRMNIPVTTLTTGPNASRRVAAFNAYANPNFGRWRGWLQRPDTAGPIKNVDALATRGATWSFLRYAADRLNGTDATFWSALVNTQSTGTANLSSALGGADVNDWTRDYIAATYGDDAVSGIGVQYTHPSWNYRSLYTALNGSYQLVPRPLTNGVGLTLSYSRGGSTAYTRFGVPASGFATVTALSGGVPPASPYSLIVMRTK